MKKKIISLLLIAAISTTTLISCGKTQASNETDNKNVTTEQTPPTDSSTSNSKIVGDKNNPTVEIKQIATIEDFKNKSKEEVSKLLGSPVSENGTISTYEKDNFSFEINYTDSKSSEIRIIPKIDLKYPADGANILKLIGINAGDSDKLSPAGLEWDNKYGTSKINVVSNNQIDGKISYAIIDFADTNK